MSKHTPGPWVVGLSRGGQVEIDPSIATAYGKTDALANARLIAAAPDLLEALRLIAFDSSDLSGGTSVEELQQFARLAIAKAEGA